MAPSARFTEDFAYEVLSVVGEIPEGTVATYGQIARLIGRDKNSRLVARVLSHASDYGDFPCHRVVNHAGRLVPGWPEQAFLLRQEGVELKDAMHVDLRKYQWDRDFAFKKKSPILPIIYETKRGITIRNKNYSFFMYKQSKRTPFRV